MEIYELEEHCEKQLDRLPKTSKGYEEHLLTLTIIKTNRQYFNELNKQDRQIDLMADFINKTGAGKRAFSCMFVKNDKCNENGCRYCIKQYFKEIAERKSEEWKLK